MAEGSRRDMNGYKDDAVDMPLETYQRGTPSDPESGKWQTPAGTSNGDDASSTRKGVIP